MIPPQSTTPQAVFVTGRDNVIGNNIKYSVIAGNQNTIPNAAAMQGGFITGFQNKIGDNNNAGVTIRARL